MIILIKILLRIHKSDNLTYLLVASAHLLTKLVIHRPANLKWMLIMGISRTAWMSIKTFFKTKIRWLEANPIKLMKTSLWLDQFQSLILILKALTKLVQKVKLLIYKSTMLPLLHHLDLRIINLFQVLIIFNIKLILLIIYKEDNP